MIVTNSNLIPRPESIVGWAPVMALNANTDLAALDPSTLANGFVLLVSLTNPDEKTEVWKLRALAGGEADSSDDLVVCTADNTRCWKRLL